MRIANLNGRAALVTGTTAVDVHTASDGRFGPDVQGLYDQWEQFTHWASTAALPTGAPFEPTDLGSPVTAPRQVIAVGLNYREHAEEAGYTVPQGLPPVFTKFVSSITGPYSTVELPEGNVDWEVEVGAVVGKTAHRIDESQVWDHIAGLTITQDLSERVLQMSGPAPQFSLGKSHPGFLPVGPWVVTLDEFPNVDDLKMTCSVNGEIVQDGTTSELLFPVPTLVARISQVITLYPGDLILTGTPAGVGFGRNPQRYLNPGDTLVSTVDGIGEIRQNLVAAG